MTKLIPLTSRGRYTLLERAGCSSNGWLSLKLERRPRLAREKNNWFFGWSVIGARLSRTTDSRLLAEHHPKISRWVVESLRANIEVR